MNRRTNADFEQLSWLASRLGHRRYREVTKIAKNVCDPSCSSCFVSAIDRDGQAGGADYP